MKLSHLWLRARLALARINPVVAAIMLCLFAGAATYGWLLGAREKLALEYEQARQAARTPAPPAPPPPEAGSDQNLAAFQAVLGDRNSIELQLKEVFALAAKHGLSLRQGEYRSNYDRNARLHTYQVNLPVKGGYDAIWQFALATLRTLPHASLDDVSFRRDSIGQTNVEARLRLTLYLAPTPGVAQ